MNAPDYNPARKQETRDTCGDGRLGRPVERSETRVEQAFQTCVKMAKVSRASAHEVLPPQCYNSPHETPSPPLLTSNPASRPSHRPRSRTFRRAPPPPGARK